MILNKLIKQQENVIKLIEGIQKDKSQSLITYLNQHCFNIYNSNLEYKNLLDEKFTVFLDGFGVYAALRFLGYKDVEKFNATDLYKKIFRQFYVNQTKLFLIGGNFTEEFIFEKAGAKNLKITGYSNGYFVERESDQIIEQIGKSLPEAIVIGMGVPKQEILAAKVSERVNAPILCVGGFFEFYFGTKKRAPKMLRSAGLEWIHRLITEPCRLWKRYLIGLPLFIFRIIKLKFSPNVNNYQKN